MTGKSEVLDQIEREAEVLEDEIKAAAPGASDQDEKQETEKEPEPLEGEVVDSGLDDMDTGELLENLLGMAATILFPAWELQDAEIRALSDSWAPVIDKHFGTEKRPPEFQAAIVSVAILGPRVMTPRKLTEGGKVDGGE